MPPWEKYQQNKKPWEKYSGEIFSEQGNPAVTKARLDAEWKASPDYVSEWGTKNPIKMGLFGDLGKLSEPTGKEPEWFKKNPNLAGLYGVGSAVMSTAGDTLGNIGAIGASLLAPEAAVVAPAIGYGAGANLGRNLNQKYQNILEPQDPLSLGKESLNTASDVLMMGAGTKLMSMGFKGMTSIDEKITESVKKGFMKGVKPSVQGKSSEPLVDKYINDAENTVKSVIMRSDKLPQTVSEFAEATTPVKNQIWEQSSALRTAATKEGIKVDLHPIIKNIRKEANNPNLIRSNSSESRRLLKLADDFESLPTKISPTEAEDLLMKYNKMTQTWFEHPDPNSVSSAASNVGIGNDIRKALYNSFPEGKEFQALRAEYGHIMATEKDITHRALIEGRKNAKGFFDLADMWGTGRFASGVVTMNPALITEGLAEKIVAKQVKRINSPDRYIKNMFKDVEKQLIKSEQLEPRNQFISRSSDKNPIGENLNPGIINDGQLALPAPAIRMPAPPVENLALVPKPVATPRQAIQPLGRLPLPLPEVPVNNTMITPPPINHLMMKQMSPLEKLNLMRRVQGLKPIIIPMGR
jgi:hypothetical protein